MLALMVGRGLPIHETAGGDLVILPRFWSCVNGSSGEIWPNHQDATNTSPTLQTVSTLEVERRHPSNLLDSHMQSAYTCGKSDGPVQHQRSREAQLEQATIGDTAFRGVSLPRSCVILLCVVIICSVWVFSPVYPPMPAPTNPPGIPTTSPRNDYPIPSNSYGFTVYGTSPSQVESLSSWQIIPILTRTRSFTATGCPRRTDWASSISPLTGGF